MPIQQPIPTRSPAETEDQMQAVVLAHLIGWLPAQLTIEEIVRELAGDSSEFGPCDRIRNAVRDLTRVGLARANGSVIIPTRTAIRYAELPRA